jgi:hypothetical protein
MLTAARRYPAKYDWPYTTISSLIYPDRNPFGHAWAAAGVTLCGMGGLIWTLVFWRKQDGANADERGKGLWILLLGYLSMTCCGALPELRIPKAHEFFALTAFVALCVGLVCAAFDATERSGRRADRSGSSRVRAWIVASLPLAPIVLAAAAQGYLAYALPGLPWVTPAWRARGIPVYLSFAFWEWVTCLILSVYMALLAVARA